MLSYKDELMHYGVKGMHWGIRRTPEQLGHINHGKPKLYKLHNYRGKLYFISQSDMDGKMLNPRIPQNFLTKNGYEDNTTPRICFAPDVGSCLTAMSSNVKGKKFGVYEPVNKPTVFKPNRVLVPDSEITNELWVVEPVKLRKVGDITCTGSTDDSGKKYTYGNYEAELYSWEYEWHKDH